MITINHCKRCEADFMIPAQYFDGLDSMFVCPECRSPHWIKLSEMSLMKK